MRKLLAAALVVSVPAVIYAFPFACGFLGLPKHDVLCVFYAMLILPATVPVVVARLLRTGWRWWYLGLGAGLYGAAGAAFLASAPLEGAWILGFTYNMRLTTNPAQIQRWATEAILRYEQGKLKTEPVSEYYWAMGRSVSQREIPAQIRKMGWHPPFVEMATVERGTPMLPGPTKRPDLTAAFEVPGQTHCVVLTWGEAGLVVGPPDFKLNNEWYSNHHIIPGVFIFLLPTR